ncbi:anillin isoform X2 [Archocentrus centrarchus]|uniref:anillin isoform X2 n=1 Tax=Archocentrus centrarchus TaxID=63155 RepID=UPI0011EA3345|nr:anillin isoform X2 [Archocentrus centrarchus]
MDPFTEKLLERTRARRENLQKKLAERTNASNRQMEKRPREPLVHTNTVIIPQTSTKPSPSKRRCSGENVQPAAGEENQEPVMPRVPLLSDPSTDNKAPVGLASVRPSSSLEKTSAKPVLQFQSVQLKTAEPEPDKMSVSTALDPPSSKKALIEGSNPAPQSSKEERVEDPAPAGGMKSRLQKLAEERKGWDTYSTCDTPSDCIPVSMLKRPAATHSVPSETGLGRRGRLANLAATIGSWEDDLSHAKIPKEKPKEKPATSSVPRFTVRGVASSTKPNASVTTSTVSSKSTGSSKQVVYSPVKSSQVLLSSFQKADTPASKYIRDSVSSPQKCSDQDGTISSIPEKTSIQETALPSTHQKARFSPMSVPQNPLKNQAHFRGLNVSCRPQKPELCAKLSSSALLGPKEKATAGAPGVKSFLKCFEERCQEHSQSSDATVSVQTKTPNTRPAQERSAQAANTTTADITLRQKPVNECEVAQIHSHFQQGSKMRKDKNEEADKKHPDNKEELVKPVKSEVCSFEAAAPCDEKLDTPDECTPPVLASSPLKMVAHITEKLTEETPEEEGGKREEEKVEVNVDQSIKSTVIDELFGDLEQSEDHDEEDALNISSMSLLTPLAEVVNSPEERMMTSTPANSFIVKSTTPDSVSKPIRFQRANLVLSDSLDSNSVNTSGEDHKLPYSIDAYRSTRVKNTERPSVKQVIVRKEDISQRAEQPRGSSLFSAKQKMKILINEIKLQETVIHQASQALNCCTDEEHGKGSQVEAEAERLLLVATEKRKALKVELDHLRGEPAGQKEGSTALQPAAMTASKGSITLQELRLPLKADFVCSTANKPESTKHSFFIMIHAGAENTVATPLASTHCGLSGDTLAFPTKFTISDVASDFDIRLEVYCLVQKREICSDKKKKPSKSKAITPKRFLAVTKSTQTPVVASPGGPGAVRTSNFVLVGSYKLTLSSVGKNKFSLNKVPFLCPLEGHVYLKMQCEVGSKVEERGFLTMFEDVSGFGAWHRRWCVLSGYCISYWTYPDDEKRKNPIGRINLPNCTSKTVEPASREFCARPNTFELITVRPRREDDRETLVSQCQNTMCVTRNWLSADTKDERNLWMKKLNQILLDLHMWQPEASYTPLSN